MSAIVTRLFDTYEHASRAVAELETVGIRHSAISLVANNIDDRQTDGEPVQSDTAPAAGAGATLGTVLGGGAGLLAGLGMMAIPGIGPVVAAGWLVATAVGAGVGAASGSIIGALVGAGVGEGDAHLYAEGIRRGGTLVTVRSEDGLASTVESILDTHGPVDTATRAQDYRAEGWQRFDETAPAHVPGGSAPLGDAGAGMGPRGAPLL